jgi:hypothetical protein
VLPCVLDVHVSYYAFYICLAKKLPEMKKIEKFLKENLLIKWSKYLKKTFVYNEGQRIPSVLFPAMLCRCLTVFPSVAG